MRTSKFVQLLAAVSGSRVVAWVGASCAHAAPVYSTSVTVAYDPTAPSYTGGNFASASNTPSYVVRTGEDATFLYVDVTSTPNPSTNTSLQFSNIYVGGANFNTSLMFEVTNNKGFHHG